jgi:hypothetical protein
MCLFFQPSGKGAFFFIIFIFFAFYGFAQSVSGTRGLIHIPTAELYEDKTFIMGAGLIPRPYFKRFNRTINPGVSSYLTLTLFPFMEVMFRYTHELNERVTPESRYFPDRMMSFRFQILKEKKHLPALLVGFKDVTAALGLSSSGANNYSATYLVGTKSFNLSTIILKTTMGYSFDLKKIKSKSYRGFFGGVELISSKLPDSSLMIEYNSFHPIVGLQHFFFNRFQVMVGAWDLKKLTLNLSYRYNL